MPGVLSMHISPEAEATDRPFRVGQPAADRAAVGWVGGAEHRRVGLDSTPIRPALRDDHPRRYRDAFVLREPAALARNPARDADLAIEGRDELVDVDDLGLQLDDEECAACPVEREDVDDAPVRVERER